MDLNCGTSILPLLNKSGICLEHKYFKQLIQEQPETGFIEMHIEDIMGSGFGLYTIEQLEGKYNFSLNISGFNLYSSKYETLTNLKQLKSLIDKVNPLYITKRLTLNVLGEPSLTDMLPVPYNKKSLNILCDQISYIQDYLSCQILIENPLSYISLKRYIEEPEFLTRLVEKTSCNLMLNLPNIYINSFYNNFLPEEYIDLISANIIKGIKLYGYDESALYNKNKIIFDVCSHPICDTVWKLYSYALAEKGYIPTTVEWNYNLPNIKDLVLEAYKCDKIINYHYYRDAA